MTDEQLQDELNELPEEEREETDYLLRLAHEYASSGKTFKPTFDDIRKRAKEKNISFNEAKRELRNEIRFLQMKMVTHASKGLRKKLSKNVRQKVGIKSVGRPKGSKKVEAKLTKSVLDVKLSDFIKNYYAQEGTAPTQQLVAETLGLGYAKKLRRMRQMYGDKRDWRTLVSDILIDQK